MAQRRILLVLVLLSLSACSSADSTVLYVSVNGTTGPTCGFNESSPCSTVGEALANGVSLPSLVISITTGEYDVCSTVGLMLAGSVAFIGVGDDVRFACSVRTSTGRAMTAFVAPSLSITNIVFSRDGLVPFTHSDTYLYIAPFEPFTLTIDRCSFFPSASAVDGGAIALTLPANNTGSVVKITNSYFYGLSAVYAPSSSGGAISVSGQNTSAMTIKIINCTFTSLISSYYGGAVSLIFATVNFTSIEVVNCTFSQCSSFAGGGVSLVADALLNSTISINGSDFTMAHARDSGGAVYINPSTALARTYIVIGNSSFTGCSSVNHGGSVAISFNGTFGSSAITITQVNVTSSSSDKGGGIGIWAQDQSFASAVTVSQSRFKWSNSTTLGGGLWLGFYGQSTITAGVKDSVFDTCLSNIGGGLIITSSARSNANSTVLVTLTGCNFTKCSSTQSGGGAYLELYPSSYLSSFTVTLCNFVDCEADYSGGGLCIYVWKLYQTTIHQSNCTYTRCHSGYSGGGYELNQFNDTFNFRHVVQDTLFADCTAEWGGGIFHTATNQSGHQSTFLRIHFTGCAANKGAGGAILVQSLGNFVQSYFTISQSYFSKSFAHLSGGAVSISFQALVSRSNVYLLSSVFDDCRAEAYGGGISIFLLSASNSAWVSITQTSFRDCHSTLSGGGLFYTGTVSLAACGMMITLSNFTDCHSDTFGGGAYIESIGIVAPVEFSIIQSRFIRCNANSSGGGVIISAYSSQVFSMKLADTEFYTCSAGVYGGGIFLRAIGTVASNIDMDISTSYLEACSTNNSGGGIAIISSIDVSSYTLSISNTTWDATHAPFAPALFVAGQHFKNKSRINLENSYFSNMPPNQSGVCDFQFSADQNDSIANIPSMDIVQPSWDNITIPIFTFNLLWYFPNISCDDGYVYFNDSGCTRESD